MVSWSLPQDTGFGDRITAPIVLYTVSASTSALFTDPVIIYEGVDTSYVFYNNSIGVDFFFKVVASNEAGPGNSSAVVSETIISKTLIACDRPSVCLPALTRQHLRCTLAS